MCEFLTRCVHTIFWATLVGLDFRLLSVNDALVVLVLLVPQLAACAGSPRYSSVDLGLAEQSRLKFLIFAV
jgi:hypothetical protein